MYCPSGNLKAHVLLRPDALPKQIIQDHPGHVTCSQIRSTYEKIIQREAPLMTDCIDCHHIPWWRIPWPVNERARVARDSHRRAGGDERSVPLVMPSSRGSMAMPAIDGNTLPQ